MIQPSMSFIFKIKKNAITLLLLIFLIAPNAYAEKIEASNTEEFSEFITDDQVFEENSSDPLYALNMFIFGFNKVFDGLIFKPTAITYKYITPKPVKQGVHNVLSNLLEPVNFANNLFQLEGRKAGHTVARFIINTIFGFGGLFDIASEVGIKEERNDFGITLARAGVGEGPYLVLPLFGPSNVRDAFGRVVDYFLDPINYYVHATDRGYISTVRGVATAVDSRYQVLDITDSLDRSGDQYSTYRVTFTDNRRHQISKLVNNNYGDIQDQSYGREEYNG